MVRYDKLLESAKFWGVKNPSIIVAPMYYGSRSLYKLGLNEGQRAILHGDEWIIPAKYSHLISKQLKTALQKENDKWEKQTGLIGD